MKTLSDKIDPNYPTEIDVEDVKQFIKDLKFKLCNPEWNEDYKFNERWIDKLAGNLTEEEKGSKKNIPLTHFKQEIQALNKQEEKEE